MRLIRGETLKDAVAQFHAAENATRNPSERGLALRGLLRRLIDVCNAIAYAHSQGVLHRDIKPDNIMLGPFGETLGAGLGPGQAAGLGRRAWRPRRSLTPSSGSSDTRPGSRIGTPRYMSPEQAAGQHDRMGPASDVYSLGATLYTILTGQQPFAPETDIEVILARVEAGDFAPPRSLAHDIPRPLEAICLKAMSKLPEERYGSAKALAEDIEHWLADEPVAAWPEPFPVRARRWMRRHRTAVSRGRGGPHRGAGWAWCGGGRAGPRQWPAQGCQYRDHECPGRDPQGQEETKRALVQSEESRQQAEAVGKFLVEAFRSPDPSQDGRLIKVADVLDHAAEKLDKEFDGLAGDQGGASECAGRDILRPRPLR